ncbi:hypothetical protein STEG23_003050 [Scotinomys teguina]
MITRGGSLALFSPTVPNSGFFPCIIASQGLVDIGPIFSFRGQIQYQRWKWKDSEEKSRQQSEGQNNKLRQALSERKQNITLDGALFLKGIQEQEQELAGYSWLTSVGNNCG